MPEWISVKDRLPDTNTDVLVTVFWCGRWQVKIGWRLKSGEWNVKAGFADSVLPVTHWMPLPEPPKEGVQDDRD